MTVLLRVLITARTFTTAAMASQLRVKRVTQGKRMTQLIGKAAEEDAEFWGEGNQIWVESDDDSFSDIEAAPDQFDSDFNDSEDDDDDSSVDEREFSERGERGGKGNYKEPAVKKTTKTYTLKPVDLLDTPGQGSNSSQSQGKQKLHRTPIFTDIGPRAVRASTSEKTVHAEISRQYADEISAKSKKRHRPLIKTQFTQKDLLIDALETERLNSIWLENQKYVENDKNSLKGAINVKNNADSSCIRYLSRRGTYDTITFTHNDAMPSCLQNNNSALQNPPDNKCIITGNVALYRDPLTGYPYHNLWAFKELRKRFK